MKIKCRILSVFVISVLLIGVVAVAVIVGKRNKDNTKYATSVNFTSIAGSVEMYIDNKLIIHENLVEVLPSNCTFKPEFTIKKSGTDDIIPVTADSYTFSSSGKYTLECKVKSGKNYYTKDSIIINVVDTPDEDTDMYIKSLQNDLFCVGDKLNINSIAEIKSPSSADIKINCSENIAYEDGIITAINSGIAKLEISLTYDGIVVAKGIELNINPRLNKDDFEFKLSVGGSVLATNEIQINISQFDFMINYELKYIDDDQQILCWTTSEIIEIVSFDAPNITLKTLNVGEAVIYVSPANYPSVVFEILVSIV